MRCSAESDSRGEPLVGTASTITSFLLVECAGPWGVNALRDSRLPDPVKAWLRQLRGVRPLLVRRGPTSTTRVFHVREDHVSTTELDDVNDLVDLAFENLTPYDGQLFLVCTHGRHDVCCAERGRPLWQAMTQVAPEATWQVSHIGGDRFAANVLVLPDGLYYGRLTPEEAAGFVATHRGGRLDLDHLRGRSRYPFAVQAAEVFLRRHLGRDEARPWQLVHGDDTGAVFDVDGTEWTVEVDRTSTRELLTCHASEPSGGWEFALRQVRSS